MERKIMISFSFEKIVLLLDNIAFAYWKDTEIFSR